MRTQLSQRSGREPAIQQHGAGLKLTAASQDALPCCLGAGVGGRAGRWVSWSLCVAFRTHELRLEMKVGRERSLCQESPSHSEAWNLN